MIIGLLSNCLIKKRFDQMFQYLPEKEGFLEIKSAVFYGYNHTIFPPNLNLLKQFS